MSGVTIWGKEKPKECYGIYIPSSQMIQVPSSSYALMSSFDQSDELNGTSCSSTLQAVM